MEKSYLNYPEWQDTADTIHLFLQMAGKVKVERCCRRPEWAHVRLYLIPEGLTTGLIPGDNSPFTIFFDFRQHQVEFQNGEGKRAVIPLEDGLSVSAFYKQFGAALEEIGSPTQITVQPQEFYDPLLFDKDDKHRTYDKLAIRKWLQNLFFAYGAMARYLTSFRCKVHYPAYYFGTMDLTCIVFSGESAPWGKKDAVMERAFDERLYECGFWPGDISFPQAAFYAMPYPFVEDIGENASLLQPGKAVFKPEKKEFFLTLEDAFSYPDPEAAVADFFKSGFDIFQHLKRWDRLEQILQS